VAELIAEIIAGLDAVQELDFYVCTPGPLLQPVETVLTDNGVDLSHLRQEPVRQNQSG